MQRQRTSAFGRDINWSALKQTSAITPDIQQHLTNVYSTLCGTLLSAFAGSVFYLTTFIGGGLTFFAGLLLLIWLNMTPQHEVSKRLALLMGFGFAEGMSIGPLIYATLNLNPSIVTSALLGTVCIFVCFSASAYFAERRSYLYLGGFLGSALSMLFFISLFNLFFRTAMLTNLSLYGGLLVFCGFVIFDTQLIIEKASMGQKDFIRDALELFLDFVNIFIRLLIILSKDKKKERR